ncbi:MAG TPA: metal ABC transporter ATP-binding protein [Solirubrobacterales bacterium]|nr:metal ABC transporter ATP-binding protein [Solirubrobacterales bacterium]
MSAAVTANGLTVSYGRAVALDDVTVEIPASSTVALLGPNGAGKTTFFRAAIGLARPSAGSIELASRRIAFVPQRLDIEPSFPVTVADVVRMGRYGDLGWTRRFEGRDRELVAAALAELGIEHLSGRRFGDLSGGERQRTLLAQASAQDADVFLLDEPFAGLDAPTHGALQRLLQGWRERGRTVLVATHDLESAARDFDLVLCLNRRLVAFGPPGSTFTEEIVSETFAGHILRVGSLLVDTAHHHHGAG